MTATVVLELPWTKPPLTLNDASPTSKGARLARNDRVQAVRRTAHLLAQSHKLPKALPHVTVQLHYQPRDNRQRDPINITATQKALVDGLVGTPRKPGYGLALGDDRRHLTDLMPVIHDAVKGEPGRLWLCVSWESG